MIQEEMRKCHDMKRKFCTFARKLIFSEYVTAAKSVGWTLAGQDLTNFSHFKKFIATSKWDEDFMKNLHFIQYKRFKIDIRLHRWDYKLSDEFCKIHNIKFQEEPMNWKDDNEERKKEQTRSCFVIVATAIKNDYNKKIRNICMETHGKCIKERQDNYNDKGKPAVVRHFEWSDKFVHTKETKIIDPPDKTKTIEFWQDKVNELKNEISVLKQENKDLSNEKDFSFDDMFVSFFFFNMLDLIRKSHCCYYFIIARKSRRTF